MPRRRKPTIRKRPIYSETRNGASTSEPQVKDPSWKGEREMKTTHWSRASRIVSCLFILVVIAGCASTEVTERQILVTGRIPRPEHILVADFAATPADIPADSPLAGHASISRTPQTAEQIATGRQVGAEIATELVKEIRGMGLPAERASTRTTLQLNDIVIRGYLLSIQEGSTAERMAVGFGAGASDLSVAVEGYHMTAQGLRRLG